MAKIIKTTCYGMSRTWKSRKAAKEFFLMCMENSEGSEHERYSRIYFDLCDGLFDCSDE